eukprot:8365844-Alexandrium_andersonii.AAC.1
MPPVRGTQTQSSRTLIFDRTLSALDRVDRAHAVLQEGLHIAIVGLPRGLIRPELSEVVEG